MRIPWLLTVKVLELHRYKSPSMTSVSLITRSLGSRMNSREPFTVVYPLMVKSYPGSLVTGVAQIGSQLAADSQSPL